MVRTLVRRLALVALLLSVGHASVPLFFDVFGNGGTGASPTDNPSKNFIWMKALSTPSASGSLTAITVYGKIRAGTPSLAVALYTDVAGVPVARLGAEETTMGTFAAGMGAVTTTLSTPIAITSGVQYWFALRMPGNTGGSTPDSDVYFTSDGGASHLCFLDNGAGANFPATVVGATCLSGGEWAVTGIYTPTGGAAAPCRLAMVGVGCEDDLVNRGAATIMASPKFRRSAR